LKITPIYDRLQIRKAKPLKKAGRIILSEHHQKEMLLARVEAVGDGRNFDGPGSIDTHVVDPSGTYVRERKVSNKKPCLVKAGDWVLIGKYSGHDIQLDPSKPPTIILREDEILAVVTFEEGENVPTLEGDPDPVEEPVDLDQYRQAVDPGGAEPGSLKEEE
jgi:co-chaperonin GroES (HSP10)